MSERPRVAIVGSGSPARAVADSLAQASRPLSVAVIARDQTRLQQLCDVAQARAALSGGRVGFEPAVTDLGDRASFGPAVREVLGEVAPELAGGFAAVDTESVAIRLRRLRSRLRA